MFIKQGVIEGQFFGHKGLLEINVHILAGFFLFFASLLVASLLWRKFYYIKQGWFALRSGIVFIGLIGFGEVAEHLFNLEFHDFFHYLHILAAPIGLLFIFFSLLELESLYFKLESKKIVSVTTISTIMLATIIVSALLGLQTNFSWRNSVELPILIITTLPTLLITYALIAKSVDLYKKQNQLSIYSLSIFSTILSLIPILATSDALLSIDILFGRYADRLAYAAPYLVAHSILDVLLASTGAILIGSSVMLIMAPDLSSFQERIIKSAKYVVLGELATNITYQLEAPLKKIKILSELMLGDTKDTGDLIKDLKIISHESEKAMNIADDLLNYAHTADSHFQITNLKSLLDEVFSFMEPKYRHSGIRVIRKIQRPLPYLSADRSKLKHAFIDIFNKSIDLLPHGGHIIISAFLEDNLLTIIFHDNGPNMKAEELSKIFEPFYAAEPDGRGTGLGLSVARSVIQNHGGEIEVKNDAENGRDITVKLPVIKEDNNEQPFKEAETGEATLRSY